MTTVAEVNEQLDSVLLEFFEVLGSLFNEQENLNVLIKDGFFNMSRARYNMGAKSVGKLQYNDRDMKAQTRVDVEAEKFHIMNVDLKQNQEPGTDSAGVRQRKIENIKAKDAMMGVDSTDNPKQKKVSYDPLKWFGVLVPQTLRQSQSQFRKSLDLVVTIANLKQKLMTLRNSYEDLMSKKLELMKVE